MAEVFISYARADKGFALDLNAALQKLRRDTWIDWRNIPDSAQWRAEILANIEAADNFLFVISPESLRSKMCGLEVARAVANKKRIVTILHRPVDHDDLLPGLGEIQWIDYPELGFEQTFQRVIAAIDTDLDWVHQHTRFGLRATQWEANSRDNGFLLHRVELKEAIHWLAQAPTSKGRKPTELQEQYIRASDEWEAGEILRLTDLTEEKERQRQEAERQQRIATARERVAFSTLSLDEDPERSVLLAMHAVDATRSADRTVIPEAEDALHRAMLTLPFCLTMGGHWHGVTAVAVTPDGQLAVSASCDRTLKVWELSSGQARAGDGMATVEGLEAAHDTCSVFGECHLRTLSGHSDVVTAVAVTPDGQLAVSASYDRTLKVWGLGSGRELRTLSGHSDGVTAVAVTPDGRLAVSASWDKMLKVWELEGGRELRTLRGHTNRVNAVTVTPDGQCVLSCSGDWRDYDNTVRVWDLASGCELRTLSGHSHWVNAVAVTPDGKLAVSASADQTLKVWEMGSGRELRTLNGHNGSVNAVAVTPDGWRVASAGEDNTVRIWDLAGGRELITLQAHERAVNGVTWSPDGKCLLSAGADRKIHIYAMDMDLLLSLVRSLVTRNLTPEECQKYLHLDEVPPIP